MRTKRLQGMLEMVFVIMLATIYMYVVGAIVVIEMLVDEKDDRERHRVVKLVIKEWRKAKNVEPEICVSFIAIREHLTKEKLISFGHCPKRMGGGPCPNFLLFFPNMLSLIF